MAEAIPLAELALRILVLPPISRGTHFVGPNCGPKQHAHRLVELWQVTDGNYVPLAQAFRLLDVNVIAGAVLREMAEIEREGDPLYWTFPTFEELLPELRKLAWQGLLSGTLLAEGIKEVRGKRHRAVLLAELPRLTPDWELSRLIQSDRNQFIEVRVERAPAEQPVKKAWREKPSDADVRSAVAAIAKDYPPDARPAEREILGKVRERLGPETTRSQVRAALKPSTLHGRRGYRGTKV